MSAALEYCERLVREQDKDRFLSALFASPNRRPLLHALYAFDLEISAVAFRAREPMAGAIRLQWWREVIEGVRESEAAASPVAAALRTPIVSGEIDRGLLLAAIDAASREVEGEGRATLEGFEQHAMGAAGSIMRASALVLGAEEGSALDEVLGHASVAATALAALRQFALRASRGQAHIPTDLLDRNGVRTADLEAQRSSPALLAALAEFRAVPRRLAGAAMALLPHAVPQSAWPAFIHVGLAPLYLDRMERASYDPFRTPVEVAQWRRQWRLWRLARSPSAYR